jgi:hypothetical protein
VGLEEVVERASGLQGEEMMRGRKTTNTKVETPGERLLEREALHVCHRTKPCATSLILPQRHRDITKTRRIREYALGAAFEQITPFGLLREISNTFERGTGHNHGASDLVLMLGD